MTITVSVPEALVQQAEAAGVSIEAYVEELASRAVQEWAPSEDERIRAVEGILAFRRKHQLNSRRDPGIEPRAWLHQDHRR